MKRALLLLVDGLRDDVARAELAAGRLPHLAALTAGGTRATAATVFPSTTSVAYLPFLTGCLPGRCNVPSIRWLDRRAYRGHWWRDREAVRSYCGYQAGRLDDPSTTVRYGTERWIVPGPSEGGESFVDGLIDYAAIVATGGFPSVTARFLIRYREHRLVYLSALFLRHFPALVRAGHVFVAMPPLFRVDIGKQVHYCLDESERNALLEKVEREKIRGQINVTRFKGLGEMNPSQLRESTMHPDTRRLVQLDVDAEREACEMLDMLLARKRSGDRRNWLESKGDLAQI